jgi:hypothetical protein
MPKLIRLYIVSVAIGFAISAAFAALLIGFDVARLGHLVLGTEGGWLAGLMLLMFNGVVFSGVQFGIAVMGMAERKEPPSGGLRRDAVPVPVPVGAAGRRR